MLANVEEVDPLPLVPATSTDVKSRSPLPSAAMRVRM
jgi:hypothetical protein